MELDLDFYGPREKASIICAVVETLVEADRQYIRRFGAKVPPLYTSGVRYTELESWRDIPILLRYTEGDCKSLVAWRIAELRESGIEAAVHILYKSSPSGDRMHLQVALPLNAAANPMAPYEDPSVMLGMR